MKHKNNSPIRFKSLSEMHRVLGLPKPLHPLVSVVDDMYIKVGAEKLTGSFLLDFYKISFVTSLSGKLKYGQGFYDFDEGGMFFFAQNQIISDYDDTLNFTGYTIFIHPNFLSGTSLANKIKKYGFFSYSTNEALYLSETEKKTIVSVFKIIDEELKLPIDDFSQDVIISQIELLLNYSNRFYKRQFITRKSTNQSLLQKMETILEDYFTNDKTSNLGLLTVQYLAEQLNVTPQYLSDLLRSLTGQNTQQHIHNKLIEKAKEKLSTTDLSVSEIAYELGFEYSQSFSKLFKSKTNQSPSEFRTSFN